MKRTSYNLTNHAHFLTFTCFRNQFLLTTDHLRKNLLRCWSDTRASTPLRIYSYVIMPNHVHLLISPTNADYKMSQILRRLKEPFARWVIRNWKRQSSSMLDRVRTKHSGRIIHRFWQTGGGYDRNIHSADTLKNAIAYIDQNPVQAGLIERPEHWRWGSAYARNGTSEIVLEPDDPSDLIA